MLRWISLPVTLLVLYSHQRHRQVRFKQTTTQLVQQEAQLSPSDRAMRLVSSNLANCHATVQKLLIRQVLTKLMV